MTTSSVQPLHVLAIPGDGIGREVVPAALDVLRATGLPLHISEAEAGWDCFQRTGAALPDATLAAARAADAVLFGAVGSPSFPVPGYRSPIVALRRALDLYANIRPVSGGGEIGYGEGKNLSTPYPPSPISLVVVRENTEGMYAGRERVEDSGDTAIAERVITRRASTRIVRAAFELARERQKTKDEGRKTSDRASASSSVIRPSSSPKVTIVHKANVLRETCGLFRSAALAVAAEYPDIAHEEMLVDNCALQLVQRPAHFDVIVTTNLFGDILSDVASYWGGGLGLAVSANLGETRALFEPVHGSAPDIAGKGVANPLAAIGCAAQMLEWLSARPSAADPSALKTAAGRISAAVAQVQANGPRTPDMGGSATTAEVTRAVLAALA
jgi:homoisocitrate dehydrogenase